MSFDRTPDIRRSHRRVGRWLLPLLLAGATAVPPEAGRAAGSARPTAPPPVLLEVEQVEPLSFGKVLAGGPNGGSVTIRPESGRKSVAGGAADVGGYHSPGVFRVRGRPGTRFAIHLPRTVELRGEGGTVYLKHFDSLPRGFGALGPDGLATVYVGATLQLRAGVAVGHMQGAFTLEVSVVGST